MSRQLILLSFADTRYRAALDRLKEYTQKFPFDERHFLTEHDLPKDYLRQLKPWLYRRGYGYWAWKPYLVLKMLEQMNDNDNLFWCDCGCYWNASPEALKRFSEYIELLENKSDILAFEEEYIESAWTKGDLFEAMGVYDKDGIYNTLQLWNGCFGLRKTQNVIRFIQQWLELNNVDKELVTDKKSVKCRDYPNFIEHRHDQSIFSLLVKQLPHIQIPNSEWHVRGGHWEALNKYPIQGRRHKEQGRPWNVVLKNKLYHPWRILLYHYFTKCRGYHFATKSYPW